MTTTVTATIGGTETEIGIVDTAEPVHSEDIIVVEDIEDVEEGEGISVIEQGLKFIPEPCRLERVGVR
jgi:hypoxanthine-guanine phosphoribosyltransferase